MSAPEKPDPGDLLQPIPGIRPTRKSRRSRGPWASWKEARAKKFTDRQYGLFRSGYGDALARVLLENENPEDLVAVARQVIGGSTTPLDPHFWPMLEGVVAGCRTARKLLDADILETLEVPREHEKTDGL